MRTRLLPVLGVMGAVVAFNAFGQEKPIAFQPTVFWENNAGRGVILVSPTEMLIVDPKGDKYGKIAAKEAVLSAYISPDGKKLAYTTIAGVWLENLETGKNSLVSSGLCDYFRWSTDSLGFFFAVGELKKDPPPPVYNIKFLWADGDGKNLKQVYP